MATKRSSPKQRQAAADRRQAELDDLHGKLADHVQQLTDTDAWRDWLNMAAQFHTYSLNNQLLIRAQKPHATMVAGYNTWQTMGRQVRKGEGGENAIRILAPMTRRVPVTDTGENETTGTERTEHDGTVTRVQKVGFRPTSVFDVTQTDGDPLPQQPRAQPLSGDAPDGLWDTLSAFATARGWNVAQEPFGEHDSSNGYTDFTTHSIRVRDDVEDAQAVRTLAHEIGHALLHADQADRYMHHRGVAEVEAESVAHLVMGAHGVDTDQYTFDYVTGWANSVSGQEPGDVVRATAERVLGASRTVLDDTLDSQIDVTALAEHREHARASADNTQGLADRAELRTGLADTDTAPVRAGDRDTRQQRGRDSREQRVTQHPELVTAPDKHARLATATEQAADWYRQQLADTPHAQQYLHDRVGSLDQLPAGVQVGYAPAGWTGLLDAMRQRGWADEDLVDAGLVQHTKHDTLIDRFRDRVTVGLHDEQGNMAGFIARVPHDEVGEGVPKYLNTAASELFDKGRVLFGLHEHHEALSDGATPVVVEGPFDALALAAADQGQGEIAPLAPCGTAVTPHQTMNLHQTATSDRLVVAMDPDTAGQDATARTVDLALDTGRDVSTVTLPDGHDPASWAATHRDDPATAVEPFRDRAEQTTGAQLLVDRRIDSYYADHPEKHRGEVEGQVGALHAATPVLTRLEPEEQTRQGIHVAARLQLEPGTVASAIADAHTSESAVTKRVQDRAADVRGRDSGVTTRAAAARQVSTEPARAPRPEPARSLHR